MPNDQMIATEWV